MFFFFYGHFEQKKVKDIWFYYIQEKAGISTAYISKIKQVLLKKWIKSTTEKVSIFDFEGNCLFKVKKHLYNDQTQASRYSLKTVCFLLPKHPLKCKKHGEKKIM